MASTANFASIPRASSVAINTADTSRTAPVNVGTVFTAGAQGSRVDDVKITATGTTTTGAVRLWLHDGVAYRLFDEYLVQAVTPSVATGTAVWSATLKNLAILLPAGWTLRASTEKAEVFHVSVTLAGDF
jgi:hypothetical protein